ncbi:Leucine-rich_repeat domain superfamily [Hexamita inflata]|uniref:Leucine-rich_repeat domain superfamily n=1 Tax=Hexamita inflata TaxID=28002 RepID=A0ABP1GJK6_9EUKA
MESNENESESTKIANDFIKTIQNESIQIIQNNNLNKLDFVLHLNIQKLIIKECANIVPIIQSKTLQNVQIVQCDIESFSCNEDNVIQILSLRQNKINQISLNKMKKMIILDLFDNKLEQIEDNLELPNQTIQRSFHLYSIQIN